MKHFVVIGILALSAVCQAQNGLSGRRQHGAQGLSGYSGDNDWGYYGEAGAPGSDYNGYSGQWAPLDFDYNSLPGLSGYNHEQQDYEEDSYRHVRSAGPLKLQLDDDDDGTGIPTFEMDDEDEDSNDNQKFPLSFERFPESENKQGGWNDRVKKFVGKLALLFALRSTPF
ncbi:uncharacterized protein LOC142241447 [Haematobia irritans]|uniref:uncharacterized protein LOC142241447 n=1 Tax=Haematobia irritans TaxID=7368 RepID=UPI003F505290